VNLRIILRHRVVCLDPEFGNIDWTVAEESGAAGTVHLVKALAVARRALKSADEDAMAEAIMTLRRDDRRQDYGRAHNRYTGYHPGTSKAPKDHQRESSRAANQLSGRSGGPNHGYSSLSPSVDRAFGPCGRERFTGIFQRMGRRGSRAE